MKVEESGDFDEMQEKVRELFINYIKSGLLQTELAIDWYEDNLLVTESALKALDEILRVMRVNQISGRNNQGAIKKLLALLGGC